MSRAAMYVVIACAAGYGAMKLWWGLGGDLLKAQTPLSPAAQEDLLVDGSVVAVGSHWVSVVLAAAGILCARGIATARGRRIDRLLRIGGWTVGGLMVVRALGGFGFGFVGDVLLLGNVISVDDPRHAERMARWDLLLWSPYWMLFGVAWAVLAYTTRHSQDSTARPSRSNRNPQMVRSPGAGDT